jgi:ornithine carbamoyltransferase
MITVPMALRHFVSLADWTPEGIGKLLDLAAKVKASPQDYRETLRGRSLAMIFEKPSTRTRVSFEVAMFELGGQALFLGADALQLQRGEPIPDTARVLSRYVSAIVARVHRHQEILDLAANASVPVINGLSDLLHPCQALADFLTLRERFGALAGLQLAYVGDGNNVCHELLLGGAKLGVGVRVATPTGYEPSAEIVALARRAAQSVGGPLPEVGPDPRAAVKGTAAVYTDVWTSMGQESEAERRRRDLAGYSVTGTLMAAARADAVFLHCLPAHRGEEVAADVIDGPRSAVFDQAENRLHVQKALLIELLGES